MSTRRRIGIYGGTFDPIHIGHLAAAEEVAAQLSLDTVFFLPNRVPPHKDQETVSEVEHRVAMIKIAIGDNRKFELCTVELERPGPSFTVDTLRLLRGQLGGETDIFFLAGRDALSTLATWHQPDALLEEFQVVVMDRPLGDSIDWTVLISRFPRLAEQVQIVHIPLLDISSEALRRRVRQHRSIRYYVVPEVQRYILANQVYV